MNYLRKLVFTTLLIVSGLVNFAQEIKEEIFHHAPILSKEKVFIRNILLTGNKLTKNYIVFRELQFIEGESYSLADVLNRLQTSQQNLMNTSLFIDVKVNFTNWYNDSLDIQADVKERWYYIVLPYFKPIDRNWNIWIKDYALSMDRVNYGVKFLGKNITGRNDRLNIWALNGYTKKLAFNYYNPFADNKLRHGFGFDFSYAQNKEVNFDTKENVQKFYKSETKYLKKQLYAGLIYSYRRGSVERHFFRVGLHKESVDDTIALLNPNYFSARKLQVVYPEFRYIYQNYKLNYIPYPTKGELIELELTKRGFSKDMNLLQLYFKAGKYFKLPKNMYVGSVAEFHLRLPFDQPFFNQSMLGYNDSYLRGMEYYVVDGVAGGFIRNTIGKQVLKYDFKSGLPSKNYETIPFRFYVKAYADAGIVYNKTNIATNFLNNKLMYTGGIGLDILTIYDIVIRFEYSFNHIRQNGLFIHKTDVKN
jgi:outer membrane protein assembly factor BamA